jgi:formylglycine-generating enzyme required for sulfatase activity
MARTENVEILELLRANQAEILKLTALTQALAWQLQPEVLTEDGGLPLGEGQNDQAEVQGDEKDCQDQASFLPPSPVELPPLALPIAMGSALAAIPEELEVFEFQRPQVAWGLPLSTVQAQASQAYRFKEPLTERVSLEMIAIPGGQLDLARSEEASASDDSHGSGTLPSTLAVESFFMGRYPITQAQWRAVARLPQINRPLHFDPSHFKGDDRPVERISWHDAVEFCDRLSLYTGRAYRLPTEAEWEYACRAGTTSPFSCGPSLNPQLANYSYFQTELDSRVSLGPGKTTPVYQFAYANGFGLSDMHGNVLEWCQDTWSGADEAGDGVDDIPGFQPDQRVLRGGCWLFPSEQCTAASRQVELSLRAYDYIGLRVCCSSLARPLVVRRSPPLNPILCGETEHHYRPSSSVLVRKPKVKQRQLVSLSGLCLVTGLLGGSTPASVASSKLPSIWQPLQLSTEVMEQNTAMLFYGAQSDRLVVEAPGPITGPKKIVPKPRTTFHYSTAIPDSPSLRGFSGVAARPYPSSALIDSQPQKLPLFSHPIAATGPGQPDGQSPAITKSPIASPDSRPRGFSSAICDLIRGQQGLASNPPQSEFLRLVLVNGGCLYSGGPQGVQADP